MSHCLNAGGMGRIDYETETMIVTSEVVSPTLMSGSTSPAAHGKKNGTDREALVSIIPFDNSSTTVVQQPVGYGIRTANTSGNGWGIQEECTHTLDCAQGVAVAQPVAFHPTQDPISSTDGSTHALGCGFDILGTPASEVARATEVHTPLRARVPGQLENSTVTMVASGMRVRRLTPVECEKLQGFEPGYTAIPKAKDGPRYKALGNSMAVPVMRWIGQSIDYAMIWSTP